MSRPPFRSLETLFVLGVLVTLAWIVVYLLAE